MMFKNQLQELAQRSCFNLPSYTSTREGPDHAPRFKASVNFNGEIFDSPSYCTTLRQAEHAAAEVALNALSSSGPSRSLTARVLDETGVYKNLLQETAHRAGLSLPVYTTVRSGPGHLPVFTSSVELAGRSFVGESAKTKKQAEKNAAIAAWSALKTMPNLNSLSKESEVREGRDQMMTIARSVPSAWPKDESSSSSSSRVIRKKHQNHQSRRRLWRNSRDNNNNNVSCSSSSSYNNKDTEQQQWKLMDLFMDFTREGFSTEKHNWFASLLPPPPPRTTSKILPPPTPQDLLKSKQIPLETTSNYSQLIGITQDHHPKLQVKWLNQEECSNSSISSLIDNPIPVTTSEQRTKVNINIPIAPPPIKLGPVGSGRQSYGGRYAYNHNPQRIAPAVQIRSVIPVCSAPPQTMRASSSSIGGSSNSSAVKEVGLPRANASLPNPTGRPDGTQPPELSSSFRKLRL